ncbi:kinesin-4-like [Panicum miliaceum]|uniref:Kinesin-4-like n=1 Tax=Panicum miliaceum TaxID=4540 RepID=A0A3L6RR61_PANMI|nr:kinesin-4-like [Panicum miliaceum]
MSLRDADAAPPDPSRRRPDAVEWLRSLFPDVRLPPQATDDDLRAALANGRLLCALLRRLLPGALLDDATSDNLGRFHAAVERMGVPTFSAYDLERGDLSAVVTCVLALKDRFSSRLDEDHRSSTFLTRCDSEGGRRNMESKLQRVLSSPVMSEPYSPSFGADAYSPSRVFQPKQGYSDLPGCKISDLMKSSSLENAPTQSLLGVVNSILDESIERKNGQIPYRTACLLKKVIVEIERRISTQAGHIRNQNNLIKAREEKYQSRIRVLEALACGARGQTHVERDKLEGKGQLAEDDMARLMQYEEDLEKDDTVVRLTKEKDDMVRLLKDKEDIIRLMKEKEGMVNVKDVTVEDTQRAIDESKQKQEIDDDRDRLIKENNDALARLTMEKENITKLLKEKEDVIRLMKEKEDKAVMKKDNIEDRKQATVEDADRSMEEKGDIIRLTKEKEDYSNTIMKLKQELQSLRSSHEESCKLLESKKRDVVKLLTDKEMNENIILKLKQELEATKKLHEAQTQQLETKAAKVSKELEQRIKEIELMLEDSTKRRIELEESAESRIQFWKQKQIVVNKFVGLQIKNAQDLRLSSVSIRHEILNCQKRWFEELAGLGQNLKVVANTAEKYHAALADNRKLFNEIQELKGHNNRSMSATALNERSSRSHSVVTIHVQGQDLKTGNTLRGALHLVDLAGSERVDRSAVTGDRLKEAQHINKSLAALGDVIFSLSQKNAHVPYRNSKLTQVLQTSLGGHAKTLMFVQVNPDVLSYTETLSTLKFAERVSGVELGVARTNKEGKDVKELMDQLALLKDTISKKDDEIDRLQLLNSSNSRPKSTKHGDSLLKHSSSSPGMTSLGKVASFGSGAASDLDNFSDTSDRHSEVGFLLSTDENQQLGQSSANPEVSALGDVELDGRSSDVSDGGISAGAETDSSVNNGVDQEQEKTSSAGKERL